MTGYYFPLYQQCCALANEDAATLAKQEEILAAIAALQLDVDGIETTVDAIEDCVCQPEMC